jgi:hypothetical protein
MANDKGTIGPLGGKGGGYKFCLPMPCIPRVGFKRACSLGSLRPMLSLIPRGDS